jgi:hypothetical protein
LNLPAELAPDQQILGNCSPANWATMHSPPMSVRITTMPLWSSTISPKIEAAGSHRMPADYGKQLLVWFCAQVVGEANGGKAFDLFCAPSAGAGAVNVTRGAPRPVCVDWKPAWTFDLE